MPSSEGSSRSSPGRRARPRGRRQRAVGTRSREAPGQTRDRDPRANTSGRRRRPLVPYAPSPGRGGPSPRATCARGVHRGRLGPRRANARRTPARAPPARLRERLKRAPVAALRPRSPRTGRGQRGRAYGSYRRPRRGGGGTRAAACRAAAFDRRRPPPRSRSDRVAARTAVGIATVAARAAGRGRTVAYDLARARAATCVAAAQDGARCWAAPSPLARGSPRARRAPPGSDRPRGQGRNCQGNPRRSRRSRACPSRLPWHLPLGQPALLLARTRPTGRWMSTSFSGCRVRRRSSCSRPATSRCRTFGRETNCSDSPPRSSGWAPGRSSRASCQCETPGRSG